DVGDLDRQVGGEVVEVAVPAGGRDHVGGDEQPRPFEIAAGDRVADLDRRVIEVLVAGVAQGGEAVLQPYPGVAQAFERLPRARLAQRVGEHVAGIDEDVRVEVDEAGQAGGVRQVDRARAGRRAKSLADGGDPAAHDLDVDGCRALLGPAVDEPPAPAEKGRLGGRGQGGTGGEAG